MVNLENTQLLARMYFILQARLWPFLRRQQPHHLGFKIVKNLKHFKRCFKFLVLWANMNAILTISAVIIVILLVIMAYDYAKKSKTQG